MQKNDIILHLSLLKGIGPVAIGRILKFLPSSMKLIDIYTMKKIDMIAIFGFSLGIAQKIVIGLQDKDCLWQEKKLLEKHAIQFVTSLDKNYPFLLREIAVPPAVLYYKGTLVHSEIAIAVVGSRNVNFYGSQITKKIVTDLIESNVVIVSGGARGVDAIAHRQAIALGGKTCAVLGSGLLRPYPAENEQLFEQIIASKGSLISSFPLEAQALPGNFPARNRIIAGISNGCVVMQAAKRSGALITAEYALLQGREVFAVPGPIDSPLGVGCNDLLKQGAGLVTCGQDITDQFGLYKSERSVNQNNSVEVDHQEDVFCDTSSKKEVKEPAKGSKAHIISLCTKPRSLTELLNLSGLRIEELNQHLFDLSLDQVVEQDFSGLWSRV